MSPFISAFINGINFRIRGGGWFTFGNDIPCRIIWGLSLALNYLYLKVHHHDWYYVGCLPFLGYASLYIPHAAYQNMGRWASPQKSWPGFFLPTYTQLQWSALPLFAKTLNDFLGMMAVGLFRGLAVFMPYAAIIHTQEALLSAWNASLVLSIGQAIAYLLGWYVPVTITSSLTKYSAQWGEFLNGSVYTICLLFL